MTKSILFVTGTRADFGKLEPLAVAARDRGFRVLFFVTGMHMMEKYGLTKTEVHRNYDISVVEYVNQRDGDPQDIILAKTIVGFSDYLKEMTPDLVVIHGDRVEALACSIVCATNYVRCAHIEGGEVSGTIDELFRHCNTKLCSAHLVSSEDAKRRVLCMGEAEEAVHVIGSPELDVHGRPSGVSIDQVRKRYEILESDYGICVFHPVTSETSTIAIQAQSLFSTLERSGRYFVVILPNNDPGASDIFTVINALPDSQFRRIPSMRFIYFSELLKNAQLVIGNSSVGVREAPFLGIPSLDIGTRQSRRSQTDSLFHADALDVDRITSFLKGEWGKRYRPYQGFGSGLASEKFTTLLLEQTFWESPLQKVFCDSVGGL